MRLLGVDVQFVMPGTAMRVEIRTITECRASGSDSPQIQTVWFLYADLLLKGSRVPGRQETGLGGFHTSRIQMPLGGIL